MNLRTVLLPCVLVFTACAYQSVYKQKGMDAGKPIPAAKVAVARNREAVGKPVTELGGYRGKAPSVTEAMDAAKAECGRHGADFFILNVEPFASDGGYKVDGVCARSQ
jgi:hypothetical protein